MVTPHQGPRRAGGKGGQVGRAEGSHAHKTGRGAGRHAGALRGRQRVWGYIGPPWLLGCLVWGALYGWWGGACGWSPTLARVCPPWAQGQGGLWPLHAVGHKEGPFASHPMAIAWQGSMVPSHTTCLYPANLDAMDNWEGGTLGPQPLGGKLTKCPPFALQTPKAPPPPVPRMGAPSKKPLRNSKARQP